MYLIILLDITELTPSSAVWRWRLLCFLKHMLWFGELISELSQFVLIFSIHIILKMLKQVYSYEYKIWFIYEYRFMWLFLSFSLTANTFNYFSNTTYKMLLYFIIENVNLPYIFKTEKDSVDWIIKYRIIYQYK